MTGRLFRCAQCDEEFQSVGTDEQALAEALANGFDPDTEDMVVVCDDCYQAMRSLIPFPADIDARQS